MTRDGTFLIENGKIAGGVSNMRFNVSILSVLSQAELSSEAKRTTGYSYSIALPSSQIENFRFTSQTEF